MRGGAAGEVAALDMTQLCGFNAELVRWTKRSQWVSVEMGECVYQGEGTSPGGEPKEIREVLSVAGRSFHLGLKANGPMSVTPSPPDEFGRQALQTGVDTLTSSPRARELRPSRRILRIGEPTGLVAAMAPLGDPAEGNLTVKRDEALAFEPCGESLCVRVAVAFEGGVSRGGTQGEVDMEGEALFDLSNGSLLSAMLRGPFDATREATGNSDEVTSGGFFALKLGVK